MKTLGLGIAGCGSLAERVHLPILTRARGVRVVGLAEPEPARRALAVRRAPSASVYEDYRDLIAAPDVDAVVVCLPTSLHAAAACEALRRRKHVYLEKPLAITLEQGRRILDAWAGTGLVGMMGFNYRFNRLYRTARHVIRSGRLGRIVAARSVFTTPPHPLAEWRRSPHTGGGALLELASHHADLVRFLFGEEVLDVSATVRSVRSEADGGTMQMRLGGGIVVQSFFSTAAKDDDRLDVYGEDGRLSVDRYRSSHPEVVLAGRPASRLRRLLGAARSLGRIGYALEKLRSPAHEPSFAAALADFVAAIREDRPASPDLRDGYRSLAVIRAAIQSAGQGAPVGLAEADRAGVAG